MHAENLKETINLNLTNMTKKLLLGIMSIALTCSTNYAAIQTAQFNKAVKFNTTTDKGTTMMRAAAEDTQIFLDDFEDNNVQTVPNGWTVVDPSTSQYGGMLADNYYAAYSGDFYFASGYDDTAARNAWAFAPAVTLEAGHTYHFGIWSFCQGYRGYADEWRMTIGTAQTAESQTNIIIDRSGSNAIVDSEWTLCSGTFTPTTTGTYYPALHHCTQEINVGMCFWDYFQIDSDHVRILPQGSMFSMGGLWSLDGHTQDEEGNTGVCRAYMYEGETLKYGCIASNCTSVEWDFGSFGTTPNVTAAQPVVTYNFPEGRDEVYNDVFLIMKNDDGEAYALREFYINRIGNNTVHTDFVSNIRPEDGFYMIAADGNQYNALSGLNTSYSRLAERYLMDDNVSATITGAYILPLQYKMTVINRKKEFTVRVLSADENNMPGSELYSEIFKFEEVFGNTNFQGAQLIGFGFSQEVAVKGTFFIEFEFPSISIGSNNSIFFATTQARAFANDNSSYFYNPTSVSGMSEGWYSSNDYYGAGISSAIYPLVTFQDMAGVAAPSVSECTVYANGKEINIVNAQEGSEIVITDIAGRVVLRTPANAIKTTLNTNLSAGVYVVTVDGVSTKVALR